MECDCLNEAPWLAALLTMKLRFQVLVGNGQDFRTGERLIVDLLQIENFVEPVHEQGLTIKTLNYHFPCQVRSVTCTLALDPEQRVSGIHEDFSQISASHAKSAIGSMVDFANSGVHASAGSFDSM